MNNIEKIIEAAHATEEMLQTNERISNAFEGFEIAYEEQSLDAVYVSGLSSKADLAKLEESNEELISTGVKFYEMTRAAIQHVILMFNKWFAKAKNLFLTSNDNKELIEVIKNTSLNKKLTEKAIIALGRSYLTFNTKYWLASFRMPFNFKIKSFSLDRTQENTKDSNVTFLSNIFSMENFKIEATRLNLDGLVLTPTFVKSYRAANAAYMAPMGGGKFAVFTVNGKTGDSRCDYLPIKQTYSPGKTVVTLGQLGVDLGEIVEVLSRDKKERLAAIEAAHLNIGLISKNIGVAKLKNGRTNLAKRMTHNAYTQGNINKMDDTDLLRIKEIQVVRNQIKFATASITGIITTYNDAVKMAKVIKSYS